MLIWFSGNDGGEIKYQEIGDTESATEILVREVEHK